MNKKFFTFFMMFSLLLGGCTYALDYNAFDSSKSQNLSGYVLFVPAGITTKVLLSQGINSQSAVVGQGVDAILTQDLRYNNTLIAAAGSVVSGYILQAKKAGFGDRNAQLMIKFTKITTPYNNTIPISAVISTSDSTGVLKGGTMKESAQEYAKNTAIGAGSGAVLGTALGAMAGGSVGKGAVYGTALGAGLGLAKGIATKGEDIVIPANSELEIVFNQPITLGAQ